MTMEVSLVYLDHFQKHSKCSAEDSVLFSMDNHVSHISLEAVERAKLHRIAMQTAHPHTAHKLQSLDKTVFGPIKK